MTRSLDPAIGALLAPIGGADPCGLDLEYDPEFMGAAQLSQRGQSEPPWEEIFKQLKTCARRGIDLRVLVLVARAWANMEGLPGLVRGVRLLREAVATFWSQVHPREGKDLALTARADALASLFLARPSGFAWMDHAWVDFTRITILEDGDGQLTLAQGLTEPAVGGSGFLARIRASASAGELDSEPLLELRAEVGQLRDAWNGATGGAAVKGSALDFHPLLDRLDALCEAAATGGVRSAPTSSAQGVPGGAHPPSSRQSGVPHLPKAELIENRKAALELLEQLALYFEEAEPSNPAPLLIRRAKALASMSFLDIVKDLLPNELEAAYRIAGREPPKSDS